MDVIITDQNLNDLDIIDQADVIWTTLYNGAGDFELCLPLSQKTLAIAKNGSFACREDTDTVMVIEKINIKTDKEAGDFLVVSGRSAESLLDRRIIWNQTNLNTTTTSAALQIVKENLLEPSNASRKMDILQLGYVAPAREIIQRQLWGESLLESVVELLEMEKMGFRVRKNEMALIFDIFQGVDRSEGNAFGNTEVIFSEEYDNLLNSEYSTDLTEYKNVALVSGEGEGTATKMCQVGSVDGFERREMYLEKGSTSTNEGTITDEDYSAVLKGEGETALKEKRKTEEINAELVPNGIFKFREDYQLGDIVTLETYGTKMDVRIIGTTENEDSNGSNLVLNYEKI